MGIDSKPNLEARCGRQLRYLVDHPGDAQLSSMKAGRVDLTRFKRPFVLARALRKASVSPDWKKGTL